MTARAFITGLAGPRLQEHERAFVRAAQPLGLILFKRNIEAPDQIRRLVGDFRESAGTRTPVLVDQEGGRVQRFGPPHWPRYPAGAHYAALYRQNPEAGLAAAQLGARLIAADLAALGVDVDCLPIADVPAPDGDKVIGDRAYGATPDQVAAIAAAVAAGLLSGGVLPVLKHLPGHGRATVDSHAKLPVVNASFGELDAVDFAAFRPLAGLPMGMTAHVVFSAVDPVSPATTSATMIGDVIRDSIGFQGLLMSDDISMGALSGTIAARTQAALAAGCDVVLHCNGSLPEMEQVAATAPLLRGPAKRRADAALGARRDPEPFDLVAARADFARMLA